MKLQFIQIFQDTLESLEAYDDAELGRLIRAMGQYAFNDQNPEFDGAERYIWPTLRRYLDQCAKKSDIARRNASGAQADTRDSAPQRRQANASKPERNAAKTSKAEQGKAEASETGYKQEYKQEKEYEQDHEQYVRTDAPAQHASAHVGFGDEIDPAAIAQRSRDMDAIIDQARHSGLPVTCDADLDQIDRLQGEHSAEHIIKAIQILDGKDAAKRNWKYVCGILKSEKAREYTFARDSPTKKAEGKPDGMMRHAYTDDDFRDMVVDLDKEDET